MGKCLSEWMKGFYSKHGDLECEQVIVITFKSIRRVEEGDIAFEVLESTTHSTMPDAVVQKCIERLAGNADTEVLEKLPVAGQA